MKTLNPIRKMQLFPLILCLFLFTGSCNNDDNGPPPENPADVLPPATQTGAQTFGCLIDGEPFFPGRFGRDRPNAFYQFVRGAFTLGISASRGGGPSLTSIGVSGLDIEGLEERTYSLISEESGNFDGHYRLGGGVELNTGTTNENPGMLTITNFDEENFIVSGTFEFTVLDNEGNEIRITEGRFDLNYTN